MKVEIPSRKLGVLIPGMGAVASTFIAGVEAIKAGIAKPIGSMTQMGTIRLGKRTEDRVPVIKDFVPLNALEDLVFAGWDITKKISMRSVYEQPYSTKPWWIRCGGPWKPSG